MIMLCYYALHALRLTLLLEIINLQLLLAGSPRVQLQRQVLGSLWILLLAALDHDFEIFY
jgi:hypothetical protein